VSERHPSSLRLDALALGAVDDSERATLEQHLAACETCRARKAQSAADRERFSRFVFPRTLDAVRTAPSPAPWGRLVWLFAPALALLAVIVGSKWHGPSSQVVEPVAPVAPISQPVQLETEVRLEVRELADGARELADGAAVKVGSRLRFRLWSSAPQEFCLLLVDGTRQVTLVGRSDHSGRIVNGRTDLDGSYLVERRTAPARVFALFSPEVLSCDQIRASVDRLQLDAAALRTTTQLALPPTPGGQPSVAQRSLMLEPAP
jgi:hypothetical protein